MLPSHRGHSYGANYTRIPDIDQTSRQIPVDCSLLWRMYPVYDDDEAAQSIIHQYMAVLNWHAEIFAARDFGSGQLAKRVCTPPIGPNGGQEPHLSKHQLHLLLCPSLQPHVRTQTTCTKVQKCRDDPAEQTNAVPPKAPTSLHTHSSLICLFRILLVWTFLWPARDGGHEGEFFDSIGQVGVE